MESRKYRVKIMSGPQIIPSLIVGDLEIYVVGLLIPSADMDDTTGLNPLQSILLFGNLPEIGSEHEVTQLEKCYQGSKFGNGFSRIILNLK